MRKSNDTFGMGKEGILRESICHERDYFFLGEAHRLYPEKSSLFIRKAERIETIVL